MQRWIDDHFDFSRHRAARSEEAAAAVAAGAAEVPWVGGVGGPGAVALSPVLPVVLTATTQLFLQRRAAVRSRAGRPSSLPARQAEVVRVHLWAPGNPAAPWPASGMRSCRHARSRSSSTHRGNPPGRPSCSVDFPRGGLPWTGTGC